MSTELKLIWKAFVNLDDNSPTYNSNHLLFNVSSSKNFLNEIGGIENWNFSPKRLNPTLAFYNAIQKFKIENKLTGKKLPFTLFDNPVAEEVNIGIHIYGSKVAVINIEIKCKKQLPDDINWSKLRDIKNHPEIYSLTKIIAGMVTSGHHRNLIPCQTLKIRACTSVIQEQEKLNLISKNFIISELTGHSDATEEIVNSVISKNSIHQVGDNQFYIDRQGVLALISLESLSDRKQRRRFESLNCLFELAQTLSRLFLTNSFHNLSDKDKCSIQELIYNFEYVFISSTSNRNSWSLFLTEFELKKLYERAEAAIQPETEQLENLKWYKTKDIKSNLLIAFFTAILGVAGTLIVNYKSEPAQLKLSSPSNGFELTGKNILFKWEEVEGAHQYSFKLQKKQEPPKEKWLNVSTDKNGLTTINSFNVSLNLLASYQWRVEALDKQQNILSRSNWRSFSVKEIPVESKEPPKTVSK
jgi:hypothetical protein